MSGFKVGVEAEVVIYSDKRGRLAKFKNMILDAGLVYMGASGLPTYIWLGSGNKIVEATDTSLQSLVAKSNTDSPRVSSVGLNPVAPLYATGYRRGVRFAAGDAAGTLAEVGLGSQSVLVGRALIKDAEGVPTTITILPDEIVDVSYTVRVYPPLLDVSGTLTLEGNLGGTYDWTLRALAVSTYRGGSTTGWSPRSPMIAAYSAVAYEGNMGSITSSNPSGASSGGTLTHLSFDQNTLEVTAKATWLTPEGNFSGGIRSVRLHWGCGNFQIEFNPPIPKTSLDTLELVLKYSYGRYTP